MKVGLKLIAGLGCMGLLSLGSTISSFSVDNSTSTKVTVSTFDAFGNNMGPMVITFFTGGGSTACTWVMANGGCSSGDFGISYSPLTDQTYPSVGADGAWNLSNNSDSNITSVTINTLAGNVALDRCMTGPSTFNDNNGNNNPNSRNCGFEGTSGSNLGWTANDRPGGSTASATAQYSDLLYTGANAGTAVGDLYGFLTLSFGETFNPGETFTWRMDTDLVQGPQVQAQVPEPATLGLVGGVLLALGALRRKIRG